MFKKKQPQIQLPESPKIVTITEDQFINMVIDYESGKLDSANVLVLFSYIIVHEKWERYKYDWIIELIDYGVLTDEGLVNPAKLKEYRESKVKTRIKF